ncbi:MAG: glycosyltransferase [Actinomycetota bacterium]
MLITVLLAVAAVIYTLVTIALFIYGANLLVISVAAALRRRMAGDGSVASHPVDLGPEPPVVTVQIPIYNEFHVAERVIDAAAAFDYPRDRLQIQVLDDSTDETAAIVDNAVGRHRDRGLDIEVIRREDRVGYKAGALANGLALARGELIAIFDADFTPAPDFLRRLVPDFDEPDVGFVQARWGHLNREQSHLTTVQAPGIDAHFLVEQATRARRGWWFNFNGTAGIWRRTAIDDAGGWRADTLTEDLDLSYRAQLSGWRACFRSDVDVPGELPATIAGFRRQQYRWARGSLHCAVLHLPSLWRSSAPIPVKAQSTLHLLGYGVHVLLTATVLTYPFLIMAIARFDLGTAAMRVGAVLGVVSLAPVAFLIAGQSLQAPSERAAGWRLVPTIAGLVVIGSGLMANSTRAAVDGLRGRTPVFERTPKSGATATERPATSGRYRIEAPAGTLADAALGSYAAMAAVLAASQRAWGVTFFATLFAVGLITVAAWTWTERRAVPRRARSAGPQASANRS